MLSEELLQVNVAPRGAISDGCHKHNNAGVVVVNMQIQPVIRAQQNATVWGFNNRPAIIFSLYLSTISEGGVSTTFDRSAFLQSKDLQHLYVRTHTLNFGTGRSVSLYLVQRRPILGSRTISTGGIPGFCKSRGEDKNTVSRTATPHGENLLQSRIAGKKTKQQKTKHKNGCMFFD